MNPFANATVLSLPGLHSSGPKHWQTLWEGTDPTIVRVTQSDWNLPNRHDWVETLNQAVTQSTGKVVLLAHSLGCQLVNFWANDFNTSKIKGALLVAPGDTEASSFPEGPSNWEPIPLNRLPFPSILVASTNDEYVSLERAKLFAEKWGSEFVDVGPLGHISSGSGLHYWAQGRELLTTLRNKP